MVDGDRPAQEAPGTGSAPESAGDSNIAAPAPAPAAEPPPAASLVEQMVNSMTETWLGWLAEYPWAQSLIVLSLLVFLAWFAHLIVRLYVIRLVGLAMKRLPSWWAGVVAERKVLHRLVPLVPTIIIARGITLVPYVPSVIVDMVQRISQSLVVLLIALAFGALLGAVQIIYNRYPISHGRPIKGYLQVAKLIAYLAAGIMILAALMAESPLVFLTGLGAMMAVILLIFRDTLLSLVAGIQLVNNDLVRVGDWIEMPQFNADGDVMDISLNVVQVRNWDKTITSIPTHKFLDHSFKNWRGMVEAGGRRIKRPVYIDMTTIRFLTEAEIKKFSRFRLLRKYIASKVDELDEYNKTCFAQDGCSAEDAKIIANARHLSNVGTFRAYIAEYLKQHPLVSQEMTMLVRQLDPGPHGLPIEVWAYVKDTRWPIYEGVQSDIFDHILAIACEFGLRIFQEPTGHDLVQLRSPRPTQAEGESPKTNGKTTAAAEQ